MRPSARSRPEGWRANVVSRAPTRYRYGERPGIAYVFLSPWLVGAALLTVGPMLASLYLSFTDYDLFSRPNWIGFEM